MDTSLLSRYNSPVQDVEPPKQLAAENVPSADNPVADFVRDCVSEGPGAVTSDIMRGAFNAWAAEKQIEGLNTRKLYGELRRLGFKAKKDNGFYWANIAVKGKYAKAAKRTQPRPTAIKQKRDEVSKFAGSSPVIRAFLERRRLYRCVDDLAASGHPEPRQAEIFRLIRRCEDVIGDTRASTMEESFVQLLLAIEDINLLRNTEPSEDDSLYLARLLRCVFSVMQTVEKRSRVSVDSLVENYSLGPDPFVENENLCQVPRSP
jgi:hypothetical protein